MAVSIAISLASDDALLIRFERDDGWKFESRAELPQLLSLGTSALGRLGRDGRSTAVAHA